MADLITLQGRLLEAELALHRLMTGTAEVQVHHDDMSVTYQQTSVEKLRAYIVELKREVVAAGGQVDGYRPRRPLYVAM